MKEVVSGYPLHDCAPLDEEAVTTEPVTLRRGDPAELPRRLALPQRLTERARAAMNGGEVPDLAAAVELAHQAGPWFPLPTRGETLLLWEALASLGAVDLTVARVTEPHLDALAILEQAESPGRVGEWADAGLWQVYAAEGAERLHAVRSDDGWHLDGPKPWCSLADRATHALVTAWVDAEHRGLFAVDLAAPGVGRAGDAGVAGQTGTWASRGLTEVRSTGLTFDEVPAVPVGKPQWYLDRPGFAWGGAGVAAIWYGATVALARRLRAAAGRREPDQIALLHLGAVDTALARARCVLVEAAAVADDPATGSAESVRVAGLVRQVVADTAEEVLTRVGHALGPAPLTGDEGHARRVADLTVYLRQHHGERDLVTQGRQTLADQAGWRWW
jgi:alkylation response protein AidB-like acyl-CoA dehydrogenase